MPAPFKQLSTWQETAKQMQEHRDATIAAVAPFFPNLPSDIPLNVTGIPKMVLTEREVALTEQVPEQLLAALAEGGLTSLEVTKAFLCRAALAQHLVNCVTELLPERALARAAELDEYFAKHQKPIGPLHGLPISVKEHIGMRDLDLNAGFVGWVGRVATDDALILKLLWKAGAVFYVRTTQPQTLMHLETSSNIYGETVNPYNRKLTSGGSSGGEGALIGMKGSCLGIGTDIGGSIRNPCANNGLYGLKPTTKRLPNSGFMATMLNEEHIVPTVGPMSTSLEGVKIFTKVLIDAKPWLYMPSLIPMPWKIEKDLLPKSTNGATRLKIGVMWDDGIVTPHPPIRRALKAITDALKSNDIFDLVDWKPLKHDVAWEIIASLYFADGGAEEKAALALSGEPNRPLTDFILTNNPHVKAHDIASLWEWTGKRDSYREEYARHWNSTGTGENGGNMVDVILCPTGPGPAPPLNCARYWNYTSQWNLLDYPGLVFPVTNVDPKIDQKDEGYEPRNEQDKYNYELYEPEDYRDAPVSLQLVARPYEDEKLIQALELIMQHVKLPLA